MLISNRCVVVFICAIIVSCSSVKKIDHTTSQQYTFKDSANIVIDSIAYQIVKPYRDSLNLIMEEPLAVAEQSLEKSQPEGTLGNFVADVSLQQAQSNYTKDQIDFCVLNNGGLRAALPKGTITLRNVYELMPFENELVILTINGSTATKLFNFIASKNGMPVSHLQLKIKDLMPVDIKINGIDFDSTQTYRMVTSDYLAGGGDNLEFLKSAINKEYINLKLRDAIITHLKNQTQLGKSIVAKKEGRIKYEQ